MLRRLLRFAVTGFCLLSLLACLGTGWLWAGGSERLGGRASWHTGKGRFTLRSGGRRLALTGPPPGPAGADAARLAAAASRLGNEHLGLLIFASMTTKPWITFNGPVVADEAEALADRAVGPGVNALLLAALEDPGRFAGAHAVLCKREVGPEFGYVDAPYERRGDAVAVNFNGLWVVTVGAPDLPDIGPRYLFGPGQLSIDPGQRPAVRDYWHARLDAVVWSVPYGCLISAAAVPPLLWLAAWGRRRWVLRRRRRLGLCPRCEYDLRGSPPGGRCSECGEEAAGVAL